MDYSDYCKKYYFGRRSSALTGIKAKPAIAEYFLKLALEETEIDAALPDSSSSYEKYFDGTRKVDTNVWKIVAKVLDLEQFTKKLSKNLNGSMLHGLTDAFELKLEGEEVRRDYFAYALGRQFLAIANGNGTAENIVFQAYQEAMRPKKFPEYINRAMDKYRRIDAMAGSSEVRLLEDYYVCNPLTTDESGRRTSGGAIKVIEDATVEKIAEISNRIILIANGGCGKTLMLQHLFVDAASRYNSTGILPIIVELREFRFEKRNLLTNIVEAVNAFDEEILEEDIKKLLSAGDCILMFDGADEIDPADVGEFTKQLSSLLNRNSGVQVIVTSRNCETVKKFEHFRHLYLVPFGEKESTALIEKILDKPEDARIKDAVLSWLNSDFIRKHERLASNPMLLTTIVKQYPLPDDTYKTFYENVYEAIIVGHDAEKWGYKRIYRSVSSVDEFTEVFREFCAKSYSRCMFAFQSVELEKIFKRLKSKENLSNPNLMKKRAFIHDACVTACMMYEERLNYFYFDQGFQEFLFAQYNYFDEPENVEKMGRMLWNVPITKFGGDNAFRMLYDFSAEKVEFCLFLPYLKDIFEGRSDEDAFMAYLEKGYSKINISLLDRKTIEKYEKKQGAKGYFRNNSVNEPATVMLSLILSHLEVEPDFQVNLEESLPESMAQAISSVITGEVAYDPEKKEDIIAMQRLKREDADNWESYASTHNVNAILKDERGKVVFFGAEYGFDLREKQKKRILAYQEALSKVLGDDKADVKKGYYKVRDYYHDLLERYADGTWIF